VLLKIVSFVYHLYTSVSIGFCPSLTLFYACLNSHNPQQSSEFIKRKQQRTWEQTFKGNDCGLPSKKNQWVSELCLNASTIRSWEPAAPALPHYAQRKQGEQLQPATLWHTETEREWPRERTKETERHCICPLIACSARVTNLW